MNIHEYQAQYLFRKHGLRVLDGEVAGSIEEAQAVYDRLGSKQVVVKAQVHAGGRGKAGGIRIVDSKVSLNEVVKRILGTRLKTYQNDQNGQPVDRVYIVKPCEIEREMYVSAVVDRVGQCVTFIVCEEGGVDIENVVENTPEKVYRFSVSPIVGVLAYQCYDAVKMLRLDRLQAKKFAELLVKLYQMMVQYDLSLIEINPVVIDVKGDLFCLDAKINIDDNALFRQMDIRQMRDIRQEDEREATARKWELNYISLDGNVGCMVNGAGLAMATMDSIKMAGGIPANFLDVGGGVTKERVSEAFKIILSDAAVKTILINIFGGIVRCDLIAEGIINAVADMSTTIPVIVRLEGNNATKAHRRLASSGLNIIAAKSLSEAATMVVESIN